MSLVTFVSIVANPAGKRWGHYPPPKGMVMTPTDRVEFTRQELDAIAWRFLGSEFAGPMYADWPIDRRIDAYLQHHGLTDIRQRRIRLQGIARTRNGQYRSRTTQRSSRRTTRTTMTVIHKTSDDYRVTPNFQGL